MQPIDEVPSPTNEPPTLPPQGRPAYCVYIDTLIDGPVPADLDGDGNPMAFDTLVEAQRSIADLMITRLQEFLDGEREFDDAMTTEDYVVEVRRLSDGSIIDGLGHRFGKGHT